MKYLRRKLLKDVQLWYADNYKTLTEIEEQNKCKSILYICIDLRHNIERYGVIQLCQKYEENQVERNKTKYE